MRCGFASVLVRLGGVSVRTCRRAATVRTGHIPGYRMITFERYEFVTIENHHYCLILERRCQLKSARSLSALPKFVSNGQQLDASHWMILLVHDPRLHSSLIYVQLRVIICSLIFWHSSAMTAITLFAHHMITGAANAKRQAPTDF